MSNTPSTPPFLGRIWPTLIPILAACGVPTAAVGYFLTRHPLFALMLLLFYEASVFIIGFLGKVWGKLEDPLVEQVASWLRQWVITTRSRYSRQYYRYLRYQHRDFDVKGLSTLGTYTLELDQVFIELQIDPSTPHTAVVNPIQVPPALFEGRHGIWDYLTSAPLSQQHLVIIGPPGSGKTTLLKHIVLCLVTPRKPFHRYQYSTILGKMPILLFLRDHAQAINEQEEYSLLNALQDHLKKWEQPEPPEGWFQQHLDKGRCLIMLDGLDEVSDLAIRQKVVNWVEHQMTKWNQNRFLITSRPFGYRSNPLSNVAVLEVRPFTHGQVEQFIHRWYLANEIISKQKDDPGVHMRARNEAKALLQQLRTTPALFELTVNPLLLTMIATVHRYGGELPGNRVALYAEICDVFLGKRQQARGQTLSFTPAQMESVLEPLACHMMVKGIRDIVRDEAERVIKEPLMWVSAAVAPPSFLEMVENMSGLLLERESGIYSFAHQTFQEYLAAAYIKRKQWIQSLVAQVRFVWWREVILLYCAMEDASPIIRACLEDTHPSADVIELAIDCDREAQQVQPIIRGKLETFLNMGMEDSNQKFHHVIAGALLARRLRRMIHIKDDVYLDTTFITCAEYQLFLDEEQAHGRYFQPDHWNSHHFASGWGNRPVLGICLSAAEAFCTWLTKRESGPWRYRLPKRGELEQESSLLSGLSMNVGYWLCENDGFFWTKKPLLLPEIMVKEVTAGLNYASHRPAPVGSRALAGILANTSTRVRSFVHALTYYANLGDVHELDQALAKVSARADAVASTGVANDRISANKLAELLVHARSYANIRKNIFDESRDFANRLDHIQVQAQNIANNATRYPKHFLPFISSLPHFNDINFVCTGMNALVRTLAEFRTHVRANYDTDALNRAHTLASNLVLADTHASTLVPVDVDVWISLISTFIEVFSEGPDVVVGAKEHTQLLADTLALVNTLVCDHTGILTIDQISSHMLNVPILWHSILGAVGNIYKLIRCFADVINHVDTNDLDSLIVICSILIIAFISRKHNAIKSEPQVGFKPIASIEGSKHFIQQIDSPFSKLWSRVLQRKRHLTKHQEAVKEGDSNDQRILQDLLKIYVDLLIVQKRVRGELLACEGILIVKEKR